MTPFRFFSWLHVRRVAGSVGIAFWLLLSGVVPHNAWAQKTAPPTADEIAARVQAFYNQTRTFQAQFSQTYKVKAYNQTKKSTGRVVFAKPGKMSWVYDAPNGNRVISDGRILKVYEKDNNQVFEQPVEKSHYPAALSFLMGQGDLTKSFQLRLLDPATVNFEGGFVLEGIPKEATPAYQKVIFFVDGATSQVRQAILLDAQGNQNKFQFKIPSVNLAVDETQFSFIPPPGTQVIHPLEQGCIRTCQTWPKVYQALRKRTSGPLPWLIASAVVLPLGFVVGRGGANLLSQSTRVFPLFSRTSGPFWTPAASTTVPPSLPLAPMVRFSGGTFWMGNGGSEAETNESPPHLVTLSPYRLDVTEVTVAAYRACVHAGACRPPTLTALACTYQRSGDQWPMNCVSFDEADHFCLVHGRRLPTEAEWEFAARAPNPDETPWPWGTDPLDCYHAVITIASPENDDPARDCLPDGPALVGEHPAGRSTAGLLDLAGNLEEWVADWYHDRYPATAEQGTEQPRDRGSGFARVLRGGGWQSRPPAARSTARSWGSSAERGANVGFRCAQDDPLP